MDLYTLLREKCPEKLKFYLETHNESQQSLNYNLYVAVSLKNPSLVQILLEYGADCNAICKNKFGHESAFHWAIQIENMDVIKTMLRYGNVNLKVTDEFGVDALNMAENEHVEHLLLTHQENEKRKSCLFSLFQ